MLPKSLPILRSFSSGIRGILSPGWLYTLTKPALETKNGQTKAERRSAFISLSTNCHIGFVAGIMVGFP